MKKFIIAALMFMTPVAANASELCPTIGELAFNIMKARQIGMSKSEIMTAVVRGAASDITISLIELAYTIPVYPSVSMKSSAIQNFKNQAEYICYENSN